MRNNTESNYKFQAYKQRQGDGVRPVMIPDDSGEWVHYHDIEHLVLQLKRVQESNILLKEQLAQYAVRKWSLTHNDWVMVPIDISAEQLRAIQLKTEIGSYVTANMSNAYELFRELWRVAISNIKQG